MTAAVERARVQAPMSGADAVTVLPRAVDTPKGIVGQHGG